jgi:hypothetical protein
MPGGFTDLAQAVAKIGYNKGQTIAIAEVIQVSPTIRLKDASTKLIFEEDDLAINEDLLPMTETVVINGTSQTIEYPLQLQVGDKVLYTYDSDSLSLTTVYVLMKVKFL